MTTGQHISEETRRKMSLARKGKKRPPFSDEWKRNMSIGMKGRRNSEETREKISDSLKGLIRTPEHCANISAAKKGMRLSEEQKRKMSDAHKGMCFSEEWRRNISLGKRGRKYRPFSEQAKRNMAEAQRGKTHSEETRQKLRIAQQNYLLRLGGGLIRGLHETQILDAQEEIDNCKIDRDFRLLGYAPDGYCHETNTIYEVYERYHNRSVQRKHDLRRQQAIQTKLNCSFVILRDPAKRNWMLYE
jgi:very-short-patch-repair endonuclease